MINNVNKLINVTKQVITVFSVIVFFMFFEV